MYASSNRGMYVSTDGGDNWTKHSGSPGNGTPLLVHNGNLYLGRFLNSDAPIYKYDGSGWTAVSNPSPDANQFGAKYDVDVLYSDGNNIYSAQNALNDTSYIYKSTDDGASWTSISNNIVRFGITSFATINGKLLGVTRVNGTGEHSAKPVRYGGVSNIHEKANVTSKVSLYPNPFEQSASLLIEDKVLRDASLNIYSIDGRLVETLDYLSGNRIEIHRNDLSNGTYFYELSEQNHVLSRGKLIMH